MAHAHGFEVLKHLGSAALVAFFQSQLILKDALFLQLYGYLPGSQFRTAFLLVLLVMAFEGKNPVLQANSFIQEL